MPRVFPRLLAPAACAVLAVGLAAGCSAQDSPAAQAPTAAAVTPSPGTVALVDAEEFAATIGASGVKVLDVRTPEEFAAGHIEGAVNIDVEDPGAFTQAVAALDEQTTYAVYCRSGNRSASATAYLLDQGFTSVLELDGGILSWDEQGLPVAG